MADEMKAATGRQRRPLDRRVMDLTGNEWCGNAGPPMDHRNLYVHDDGVTRVFATLNDGAEVGIGYPDEWHVIMRTKAARMLAWWVFKLWLKDWLGLRSWAYYVALHRSVRGRWRIRPYGKRPTLTRPSSFEEWASTHKREPVEALPVEGE